jgi:hypothetical protein
VKLPPLYFFLAFASALIAACDRKSEIKVYRVSKAPLEEAAPQQTDMAPTNAPSPGIPHGPTQNVSTQVETPPSWESQPLSQMRQASFVVKGENGAVADISLVSLGAAAGNVLDNVNRWLNQLGQPAVTEQQLRQIAQHLTTSLGQVTIVDLAGLPAGADPAKDGRTIAAMVSTNSSTLFFKMRGNADLVEAQKADFIKWVAAACNEQSKTKSPGTTAANGDDAGPPRRQLTWKTPEGWSEVPPSAMRYASFAVSGTNGDKIDISIVTFPGTGGSDLDNVNRWRGQIQLPPTDEKTIESQIEPLPVGNTKFSTIDIAGPDARTMAAWIRRDNGVWFFKMTGAKASVEQEKSKFFDFLRSVQFNS